jgi:hypothetical protein
MELRVKKSAAVGWVVGCLMAITTFSTSLILAPTAVSIAYARKRITSLRLLIILLWALMAAIIVSKSAWIEGLGRHTAQDLFLITALAIFAGVQSKRGLIAGVAAGFLPIAILDAASNLMQLFLGTDIFGNSADTLRTDGARLTGIFGNSFYSLSIYLIAILAINAAGWRRRYSNYFVVMMLAVGSLRAYVFPLLFVAYRLVFRMTWRVVFLFSIITPVAVGVAAFLSVSLGYMSPESGNAYRLFAWSTALENIIQNPILGINAPPPVMPEDVGINRWTIVQYQIYESTLLQDAVRYGIPFVIFKLVFFYQIGKLYFVRCATEASSLPFTKNMIASLLVVDYVIFSFFGMPVVSLIAALILSAQPESDATKS